MSYDWTHLSLKKSQGVIKTTCKEPSYVDTIYHVNMLGRTVETFAIHITTFLSYGMDEAFAIHFRTWHSHVSTLVPMSQPKKKKGGGHDTLKAVSYSEKIARSYPINLLAKIFFFG